MKLKTLIITAFLTLSVALPAHVKDGKFSAKDRTEAGCMIELAKVLLAWIGWETAVQLEDKVYFSRYKDTTHYTVYAQGINKLAEAKFKVVFNGSWTVPDCSTHEDLKPLFIDQTNKVIGLQKHEKDQSVNDYLKFLYPPAPPSSNFLFERGYENPKVVVVVPRDPAEEKRTVGIALGTAVVGSALLALPIRPESGLAKKALKRVVAPLLIIDAGVRIYESSEGREPEILSLAGPIDRFLTFRPGEKAVQGVLRLPVSYENQLDEKVDEKKK